MTTKKAAKKADKQKIECPECGGSGYQDCPHCGSPESAECDECEGRVRSTATKNPKPKHAA